jgi:hypothetical protein
MVAAMSDDELGALLGEARGLGSEQVADLLRTAEFDALQAQSRKSEAAQAVRSFIRKGH